MLGHPPARVTAAHCRKYGIALSQVENKFCEACLLGRQNSWQTYASGAEQPVRSVSSSQSLCTRTRHPPGVYEAGPLLPDSRPPSGYGLDTRRPFVKPPRSRSMAYGTCALNLKYLGFTRNAHEPNLWKKGDLHVVVYVDDLAVRGPQAQID